MLEVGTFNEVHWVEEMLPELLWISLLYEKYGLKKSAELCHQISQSCIDYLPEDNKPWLALSSAYKMVPEEETNTVINHLKSLGILEEVAICLKPLISYYPTFPMSRFFPLDKDALIDNNSILEEFKVNLEKHYDRWSIPATFVQANAVYIAFTEGILKVYANLTLAQFPEIEHYPNTDLSERVASSCRAAVSGIFARRSDSEKTWSRKFWNKGLQLEPCSPEVDLT